MALGDRQRLRDASMSSKLQLLCFAIRTFTCLVSRRVPKRRSQTNCAAKETAEKKKKAVPRTRDSVEHQRAETYG